jgi:cell division protein FtsI (penicillin-binding protein 3)
MEKQHKKRLLYFLLFITAAVLFIMGKLVSLMILTPLNESPNPIKMPVVERGPILDRNGKILAISTRLNSVAAWIPDLEDPEAAAQQLAGILRKSEGEIIERLKEASGFIYIKRQITPTESRKIEELKNSGNLKGINLIPEFGRNYPEQNLASHVIGYVGVDNVGLEGIEYTFNHELSPPIVDIRKSEIYGNQVFLTIDINIQYMLQKTALAALKDNQAEAVFILVMEAKTGEILGYCSVPNFDPNEFSRFGRSSRQNLPISMAYEPGSVFKIVSIASFLQLKGITPEDTFLSNGYYEQTLPDGSTYRIRDLGSHGWVNPQLIIKYSCNAGAAYASERVDTRSFYRMLTLFGFGKKTELPLPGESSGILAKPDKWSMRSKPTIAFGQEISVSAMQMLSAATVFANSGLLLKPIIVSKIVSPQGKIIKKFNREPLREVVSPAIAREILEMMESAVQEGGTARRGRIPGIRISAKTGTAQVADPKTGKYSEIDFIASYLGIFPTDDPQLIIYTVIHLPRGDNYYGSRIAAPVFKQTAENLISYLGITMDSDVTIEHSGTIHLQIPESIKIGSTMPDLTGTPKRLLLPLLNQSDIMVRILGQGYVVRQSPAPGTDLQKGMTIVLELE